MKLIRAAQNITTALPASVVTIGNFDGVHLGHQQVIKQLKAVAKQKKLVSVVVVFEPQPIEFFAPTKAPKRLARFREKLNYLIQQDVDYLLCLKFDSKLANQTAEDFVRDFLLAKLNTKHLVIGDDFQFGKNRQGDYAFLKQYGGELNFDIENTKTLMLDNERVSSTRIRKCINNGDFEQAAKLLGKPYSLSGRVTHGQKLGRQLGFPTINIKMGNKTLIVKGIFAVLVKGIDNRVLRGVASIGTRPTVSGTDTILEVYILEFDQDVYRYRVDVEFLHKIRDELKFDSLDELSVNIARDIDIAKDYFLTEMKH